MENKEQDVEMAESIQNEGISVHLIPEGTIEAQVAQQARELDQVSVTYVLDLLHTSSSKGLREDQVEHRQELFGLNAFEPKKENKIFQFLTFMWNPLSWVMEAAAIVAIALSNGGGQPPDYQDFVGIVLLLFLNATLGFYEENSANSAVSELLKALAPTANVLRNSEWYKVEAKFLVPGDIIQFKLGDVIPADCKIIHGENIKIDQAALTGESLPVSKVTGSICYSGSTCKQGEAEAVVTATGVNSFFGSTVQLVEGTTTSNRLQEILTNIGFFCVSLIFIGVLIVLPIQYAVYGYGYREGINNLLVLLIGGVPIAMPTVLSVTLAIGASQLAKKKAIVTKITVIEELSGMDVLCSDKTGTLTKNKLEIFKDKVVSFKPDKDSLLYASRASRTQNQDAIDFAMVASLGDPTLARQGIIEKHFAPFDPVSKKATITYVDQTEGKSYRVSKGAPQIILDMCHNRDQIASQIHQIITDFAAAGYRALGVAICEVPNGITNEEVPNAHWEYIGIIPMFDPPRDDSKETIEEALARGVRVKMITGDQLAIAKETARLLGMGSEIHESKFLDEGGDHKMSEEEISELIERCDGFAGVFPEHKYKIVQKLQERGHITGMTGDGVNDAPALKVANIGIAVADATDAARGAADIVLAEPGLSVIIDAIIESRKIFQRMKTYCIYACAITVRIVLTFSLLVLIWQYNQPSFMILITTLITDGTNLSISRDTVKPSQFPDMWNLSSMFTIGIVLGIYMTCSTIIFFLLAVDTAVFENMGLTSPWRASGIVNDPILHSIIFLQVAITGQLLIFSTRAQKFWFLERPSIFLAAGFVIAQIGCTFLAVYANWGFTNIAGIGWGWALTVWVWSLIWFIPVDLVKMLAGNFGKLAGMIWRWELPSIIMRKWSAFYRQIALNLSLGHLDRRESPVPVSAEELERSRAELPSLMRDHNTTMSMALHERMPSIRQMEENDEKEEDVSIHMDAQY